MFLVKIIIILMFQCIIVMSVPTEVSEKSFMYFAYGSNLLAKRIHIKNPTAIRKNIGQLKVLITYYLISLICYLVYYNVCFIFDLGLQIRFLLL